MGTPGEPETGAAPPAALDPSELLLWTSLGRVVQRLPRLLDDAMLRSAGVTMSEFSVLDALRMSPDATARISDLAGMTGLSHSRVSRVVDAFAAKGWCRRERDAHDGRSALAVLTGEGVARIEAATPHHVSLAHDVVISRVAPESREAVIAALVAIASDQA
ncbi:MarR family winged helix-turn-helix transcriptional regulator [Actinoplanes sp. RD1]|uniref:MarR family winged helix-turn-helix transcriptional regulator n=1 Tax=Actinoplanes sp. RD1 TaxID=3064538 RepID=UPI002741BC95|nr:MarR family winged helix-turn-helix transcriptional regulator [Actinoplanes sp. RD1]